MSFTQVPVRPARLTRSLLAVPGSNPKFIDKAPASRADALFFDLEDSVALDQKDAARRNVIAALNDLDLGDKTVSVRLNGLDTPYMYRDLIEVTEQAGRRLDAVLIPKVGTAADVYAVDMLLTQIETAKGYSKRIGIDLLIETPLGLRNIDAIAAASRRNESILFGSADFAAASGARSAGIGAPHPDYHLLTDPDPETGARAVHWGDMWHFALATIVAAARAHGLRPIDGPFADIKDPDGWTASARRARTLGFEGKMVIHPSQVDLANDLFKPSDDDVAQARRVLDAMAAAARDGAGAVALDGKMIDIASIRQAEATVTKADLLARRDNAATER